jgi:hypothetical protein
MNIEKIREKAKSLGIKPYGMRKPDLIREIQKKEGNFPCFGTATDYCDQLDCCFREDCIGKKQERE